MQRPRHRHIVRKGSGRRKKQKRTPDSFVRILLLFLLVLAFLIADACRRGEVSIYREKPLSGEEKQVAVPVSSARVQNTEQPVREKKASIDQQRVRILISTTDFAGLYHDRVVLQGTGELTVSGDKKTKTYPAGKKVTFQSGKKYSGKLQIQTTPGERIQICSVSRQGRHPKYRGGIELQQTGQGFTVINELSLQEYLYAVVPSELSTGHKMEALKAQAVCARTYAYNQIVSRRFQEYGADLDDSTDSQVYNNIPEDKRSRKAVRSTAGEIVMQGKKAVTTYYYSTSWGKSASGKEVWNTKSEVSYLQSCMQTEEQEDGSDRDLSTDAAFRRFLSEDTAVTYDREADWYRWNVTIAADDLSGRIDTALRNCYQNDASAVLTQDSAGRYQKKALQPLGKLRKIRVESRGKSGLVTGLVFAGSQNVVKVCGQYNIRKVLSPGNAKIHYGGGETTMTLLPSAAFYVDRVTGTDGRPAFEIYGGGCGHGTGMSQCGAGRMAEQGKKYRDILQYYFSGCDVVEKSMIK